MIGIICLLSLIGLGYFLFMRIKRDGFKRFFNKTFKYCFHDFKTMRSKNKLGEFEYTHCEICGKSKDVKVIKVSKTFKSVDKKEKKNRVSKIDKLLNL